MLRRFLLAVFAVSQVYAQESNTAQTDMPPSAMAEILRRLDALERENRQLLDEVHELKQQLSPSLAATAAPSATPATTAQTTAPLDERVTVAETRISDQAQTKVEGSQKFPITLNGMLLFNAFLNSSAVTPSDYGLVSGPGRSGATMRQTLIGFDYQGPTIAGGGRVNASLLMDFWAGPSEPGSNWLRLRRANVSLDWERRSFTVGQDKPLISPYQPNSLAEVGVPPLAGAGNLWLWLPQARYEERVPWGSSSGLNLQAAVLQTDEVHSYSATAYPTKPAPARPALEGRAAFWHKFGEEQRIDIGGGFHVSQTHVAGASVGSRIASLDWRLVPSAHLQWTGTLYTGSNVAGLGSLGNAVSIDLPRPPRAVDSSGGWTQFSLPLTKRLTWNLFGGFETDRGRYLPAMNVVREFTYASNLAYKLGPNVLLSVEALQLRAHRQSGLGFIQNHYDLALAYLF